MNDQSQPRRIEGSSHTQQAHDEALIERVKLQVGDLIRKEVTHQEDQRFRQIRWFIAVVGLIGLGTFGTLANFLIEEAVDRRLSASIGSISESLELSEFLSSVLRVDIGDSFTTDERDAAMDYLRVAATKPEIRNRPDFRVAFAQVARSFASANQIASLDELLATYETLIVSSPATVEALLHCYGLAIVTRTVDPREDTHLRHFERLESVAPASRVPELALYYRIFFELRRLGSNSDEVIRQLIAEIPQLSEVDLGRFLRELFLRLRAANWQTLPTAEGERFASLTRNFFDRYGEPLADHLGLDAQGFATIVATGVDRQEASQLGAAMAAMVKQ